MTHELIDIVQGYLAAKAKHIKCALATVVALDGSSYRKPGVRMLLMDDGAMIGAVSGGCVEKEIIFQTASVFKNGIPKVMTYDGRFRLGCEGLLYILIEPFQPNEAFLASFLEVIQIRKPIDIRCFYTKAEVQEEGFGTEILLQGQWHPVNDEVKPNTALTIFNQQLAPRVNLIIIGAEHDAVVLCTMASNLGWEVTVVAHPTEEKKASSFPGISALQNVVAEDFDPSQIDKYTVVVLMTHSYVKDLQFLIEIHKSEPKYIGILGPIKRREKLLNEFIERCPEVDASFLDTIYGPAGLNIGAETPQEIAMSILSEILSIFRGKEPMLLSDKEGKIH